MNDIVYFIENGRKRKGEKVKCELCNTEFVRRLQPYPGRPKRKYCTRHCSAKAKQKRLTFQCYVCNKEVERKESAVKRSRNGIYFCGRKCKDFAQSLEGNCEAIQPDHYRTGTGEYSYRERCRAKFLKGCASCSEKARYKLLVHHKDGNRKNNVMSNFEIVCYNCHAVRHLKQVHGVWMFDYKALTPRSRLKELT